MWFQSGQVWIDLFLKSCLLHLCGAAYASRMVTVWNDDHKYLYKKSRLSESFLKERYEGNTKKKIIWISVERSQMTKKQKTPKGTGRTTIVSSKAY